MDLAALKRKYRFIFATEIEERLIYWRPLTLREHDIYTKILDLGLSPIGKVQDKIFREIVLSPDVIDMMNLTPPGLVPSIANAALAISGNPFRGKDDIEKANQDIQEMRAMIERNPYEQFILLICKAFPTYTPSEIEQLEYQEMIRLLVMAEKIIDPENPLKLELPKKEKSLADRAFQDNKEFDQVDHGGPDAVSIRRVLAEKQAMKDPSYRQAMQIEMINRMREKNRS